MKRKIFSISIALVLAVSLCLVPAAPASAADLTGVTATPDDNVAGATDVTYTIAFTTATALAVAVVTDTIIITFPAVFDVSGATLDAATTTPSTTDPTITDITGQVVTLDVAADEVAGGFSIVLTGIVNTETAATNYVVTVETNDAEAGPATIDGPTDSAAFAIVADVLDTYLVEPEAGPYTAGTAFNVVITAVDQFDNPLLTAYTTDEPYIWETNAADAPDGTAPDIGTLVAGDFTDSVATKSVTLYTAEAGVTFTATDASAVTGISAAITVDPGALGAYTVVPAALIQEVGTPFNVVITAVDDYENPLGGDYATDEPYTWTSTASDAVDGTEPDIDSLAAIDFTDDTATMSVTLVYAEAGVTFTVTDTSLVTGTSAEVFVEGISLDSAFYSTSDTVNVQVCDDGANDPMAIDEITIAAVSTTDTVGDLEITLTETGAATGIFAGSFTLIPAAPANRANDEIVVSEGDTVTVSYGVFPSATATVDETDPVFDADTTPDADYYKNGDTITLTVDLDAVGYTVTADFSNIDSEYTAGAEVVTDDGGGAYTVTYDISADNTVADGEYPISVTAEDDAGNSVTDTSCSVTLDNTAPAVTDPTADPVVIQPDTATAVTFSATVVDDGSGIDTVTVDLSSIGGAADQAMTDVGDGVYEYDWADLSVTDEDTYELVITATDALGNENAAASITLNVIADADAPVFISTAVEYPVGYESARPGDDVTITAVVTDALSGVETVTVDATDIGLTDSEALVLTGTDTYSATLTVDAGTAVGTKTLTVTATDYATNEATADVTVGVVTALTGYNIALVIDWNLISMPLVPTDESIDVILADISDNVSQVRTWVYEAGVLTEKVWISDGPADLTQMEDGQGYWIEMTEANTLTITGVELPAPPQAPPSYSVYEGWNLIGFKSVSASTAETYLGPAVTTTFEVMYGYDAEGVVYILIQLGTDLEPGQGYWLAVSADGTIYP